MGKRFGSRGRDDADELEELKKLLTKARAKGDFREVSNLHNRIGIVYRELSRYEEALAEHQDEVDVTRKYFPNDLLGLGVALRAKAEVYLDMKEEEKALPLIKEYWRTTLKLGDMVEQQRAHVTLGRAYFGLAIRFSEEGRAEDKSKSISKALNEFNVAKELTKHPKVRESVSESGVTEMTCGVFLNLFLVLDLTGDRQNEGLNFLRKAAEMAQANSLHELLFRAQLSLYELHLRKKAFKDAECAAQTAVVAAKALRNPTLQAEARLLEAKVRFCRNDIEGGIALLKRIRKDKKLVASVEDELDPLLRCAVRICRVEEKISVCQSYREKAKLYEILGDKHILIGNFPQAVVNYELALQNLEADGYSVNLKKKAELLFSLAETLSDLGEYEPAKKYFLKELQLHCDNPREACKTQSRLCLLLEKANSQADEVIEAHQAAVRLAEETGSPAKKFDALNNFAIFLESKKRKEEADEVRKEAEALKSMYQDALWDSSQELGDGNNDSDSGSSIDLDSLTTDEDSDNDEEVVAKTIVTKKKKFRLNEKGETPLHVAAKKGDLKAVRRLLRQGHEVNPRDSAGWIPLHEAANFGHYAVVEELLKNRGRINDQPSGSDCDKITPIHDAASNGHLDVVELLANHGANVTLKDANGNYPIDSLIICFERAKEDLSDEEKASFNRTLDLLKKKMVERGKAYGIEEERKTKRKARTCQDDPEISFSLRRRVPVKVAVDDYDPDDGRAAVDLYSSAIKSMRGKKQKDSEVHMEARGQIQALIAEDNYVDEDWLEDDLGGTRNKRRRDAIGDISLSPKKKREDRRDDVALLDIEPSKYNSRRSRRNSSPTYSLSSSPEPSPSSPSHLIEPEPEHELGSEEPVTVLSSDEDEIRAPKRVKRRRKIQTKLSFPRFPSGNSVSNSLTTSSAPPRSWPNHSVQDVMRLKVSIGEKVFAVPVVGNQLDEKIDWLAQEASNRYFESEGIKPLLKLRMKDGTLLSGSDIIRIALGDSETELAADILSFDLPRLPERFKEGAKKNARIEPQDYEEILKALDICQSTDTLNLTDACFQHISIISTLCTSLQCQFALREINLSGAALFDEGTKVLANLLTTLPSLAFLNLSLNGITHRGVVHLSDAFKTKSKNMNIHGRTLSSLNLSFNSLGDKAGHPLCDLLSQLPVRKLFIADTDLTHRMLEGTPFVSLLSRLQLEELDVRYNHLGQNAFRYFQESGAFEHMRMLNLKNFDHQNPVIF